MLEFTLLISLPNLALSLNRFFLSSFNSLRVFLIVLLYILCLGFYSSLYPWRWTLHLPSCGCRSYEQPRVPSSCQHSWYNSLCRDRSQDESQESNCHSQYTISLENSHAIHYTSREDLSTPLVHVTLLGDTLTPTNSENGVLLHSRTFSLCFQIKLVKNSFRHNCLQKMSRVGLEPTRTPL